MELFSSHPHYRKYRKFLEELDPVKRFHNTAEDQKPAASYGKMHILLNKTKQVFCIMKVPETPVPSALFTDGEGALRFALNLPALCAA